VVRVLDVASHESGAPYMVMEYLEGQDLEATLQERGELPVDKVVDYMLQALEALAEAHVAGIVHRDLKPANIFLARRVDGSPVVKVLDFGISKLASDKHSITTTGAQMGSPLYMSPEQLRRSRDVDVRADIWAIGVILQELLTGTAPFMGDSLAEIIAGILTLPPLRVRLGRPDVSPELEAVILRCLEKEPGARFSNVAELAVALSPCASERARVSTERIVRVVAGSKAISLPPMATSRVDPASVDRAVAPAQAPGPATQAHQTTDSSWHTTRNLRSARRGRRVALMVVTGVVVVGGALAARSVLGRRSSPEGISAEVPAASTAPASGTAAGLAAIPPPASAAPSPTSSAASIDPSSTPVASTAPSVVPQRPAATRPTAVRPVAPAPAPAPAPTTGVPDFGGRK
jgi:serine/threonine-protein kinase